VPSPLICVIVALIAAQSAAARGTATFPDGTRISLEVVADDVSRQRGLMFRERLAANEGMVFVFPKAGHYPFWMKNTLMPLDMLWLDESARIVAIAQSVPPCKADPCPSYPPTADGKLVGNALYVIEVVSGFARRHRLETGHVVKLEGVPRRGR
jgi:uncharacterized membrane protein (UPF0127 family)